MENRFRRLGLLGGTFDPPHMGHLWLAELASETLQLDRVLFVPVGSPPHKKGVPISDVSHRLAMVKLAVDGNRRFAVDTTDMERRPPHTTAGLLPLVKGKYPEALIWLIIGSDSLRDLPEWYRPAEVIAQCRIAALDRPGMEADMDALGAAIPGIGDAFDLLTGPTIDLSSTQIRRRVREGLSIRYLTPEPVVKYMVSARLYR